MTRGKMWQSAIAVMVAGCGLCMPAQTQTDITPAWLKWLGNGPNSFSCTTGTCKITDELWFTSFNVSAGATLVNAGGNGPLIVRSTGACTIDGTIIANGNAIGGGITGNGDFGGGGGGGGGGKTAVGITGKSTSVISGIPIVNGGVGGAVNGGAGGNAASPTVSQFQPFISDGSPWPGGGAMGGHGGNDGGAGGQGGMPVILVCNSIEFSGSIDVSGANGANAPFVNSGAGGGGGAGYVVFAAVSYGGMTGTINLNGGVGGSCNGFAGCGVGGKGGNGWSTQITIQ